MNIQQAYDIIIIGGGGSGLAAAVSAAENNAQVLLLEKQDVLGGTTGIAVGSYTTSQTLYQEKAGVSDSVKDHIEDIANFAKPELEAKCNQAMRRFHLSHSSDTLRWLMKMGLRFHGPTAEPPNRVPRMHNVIPNAKAYIAILQAQFQRLGGTILCNAHAKALINQEGTITGVRFHYEQQDLEIRAKKGVILAAGDFTSNPDMIGKYKGKAFQTIEGINPYSQGDGQNLALSVGAKMINMDVTYGPELRFVPPAVKPFSQLLPARGWLARFMGAMMPLVPKKILEAMIKRLLVTWQHPENALFDDGAVLLNKNGERFCDETKEPDREIAISQQPEKICYILLDERIIKKYSEWPHFISTAPEIAYAYVNDYIRMRPDIAAEAKDLNSLASKRSLPASAMEQAIAEYNQHAKDQNVDTWGRTPSHPMDGSRWVLLGPTKAFFTMTEGSPMINEQLQVLDAHDTPIPHLYAVGQNGLGGQIIWGHGLHISWACTSGRLAGMYAAKNNDY